VPQKKKRKKPDLIHNLVPKETWIRFYKVDIKIHTHATGHGVAYL
jgi:hypothetical protein